MSGNNGKEIEIAQLADGDYCGEQALLHEATRGATVRAAIPTKTLVLDQKTFKKVIEENEIRFATRDAKRNAISAELLETTKSNQTNTDNEKTPSLKNWLLQSVSDNILFTNLDDTQKGTVVDQMYKMSLKKDEFLIRQGEEGNAFYVVESGSFVITVKDVGQVDTLESGKCVGELALLYNAPRAASVQASMNSVVWAVERSAFRKALMDVHKESSDRNIEFLKKCELLRPLLSTELAWVDQALEEMTFKANEIIFKKGEPGERFYIVKTGIANGKAKDGTEFKLQPGSFFGERALLTNEARAATITAESMLFFFYFNFVF